MLAKNSQLCPCCGEKLNIFDLQIQHCSGYDTDLEEFYELDENEDDEIFYDDLL